MTDEERRNKLITDLRESERPYPILHSIMERAATEIESLVKDVEFWKAVAKVYKEREVSGAANPAQ
jgi:hypothetical protein